MNASVREQVRQSLRQSLNNLRHNEAEFVPEELDNTNQAAGDVIQGKGPLTSRTGLCLLAPGASGLV